MKKRKFAISDIHGCSKTFKALLEKIAYSKADELYLLGDFIDRGPDSKGVIDFVIGLREAGHIVYCLRGNHEEMLLKGLKDMKSLQMWHVNGGLETLNSFETKSVSEIPGKYINWFNSLGHYFEVDEYILVHAGLNFRIENPLRDEEAMMWIRRWYSQIDYEWLGDRIIIHGHTPTDFFDILEDYNNLEENRHLVIDGGCVYKDRGFGDLVAFELGQKEIFVQKNIE